MGSARESDEQRIERALEAYEGPLLRYATSLLGDAERARDVVQDTFLRLCRQPRHKVERGVKTWLFVTCRRRALDVLRKEKRMSSLDPASESSRTAQDHDPVDATERRETQRHLARCVAELPEKQREAIRLKFAGGLSYREIAEAMGLKTGYVGYLLHHGLKNLQSRMEAREA